jgi:hypothetical protein
MALDTRQVRFLTVICAGEILITRDLAVRIITQAPPSRLTEASPGAANEKGRV